MTVLAIVLAWPWMMETLRRGAVGVDVDVGVPDVAAEGVVAVDDVVVVDVAFVAAAFAGAVAASTVVEWLVAVESTAARGVAPVHSEETPVCAAVVGARRP